MIKHHKKEKGFVIFVSLFMVVLVTSIGIFIINISLKEFRLANIQQDSLKALYAADIGIECAFHHDIVFSAFPSISTIESLPSAGTPVPTGTLNRKTGGLFPASIDCVDGQSLSLSSVYDDSLPEPSITTTISPYSLSDVCANVQVHKLVNGSGQEYTRIESSGKNTDDCLSPGIRGVERSLFLIWGNRN